jgi:uncharacterized protein (DUF2132 family)
MNVLTSGKRTGWLGKVSTCHHDDYVRLVYRARSSVESLKCFGTDPSTASSMFALHNEPAAVWSRRNHVRAKVSRPTRTAHNGQPVASQEPGTKYFKVPRIEVIDRIEGIAFFA